MDKAGRGHWRSPRWTSLLRQSILENDIKDCVQIAFDYLQGRRIFTNEELCCFPKIWWPLRSNLCLYIQKSPHLARKSNGNPGVALEIISLHDTMSGPSWTEKELNCCAKSSLSDCVDWVDDLRQDRFPTDYRGISEHWVSSCPKIMSSLKIMPCSSRQPATGLPKAGQILSSAQQGQHYVSHRSLWLVSVRDGSFSFPASGQLWIWWEPGAAAHRQKEHSSCCISTCAVFGDIFPPGKIESLAARAVSLGLPAGKEIQSPEYHFAEAADLCSYLLSLFIISRLSLAQATWFM